MSHKSPMPSEKQKAPSVTTPTILHVYVAAAGRCSFYGCPDYVLNEPLTSRKAILGNVAHIVGDSEKGPRGDSPLPLDKRSEPENLMLMCTKHHSFIDKRENEKDYPVDRLTKWKKDHEARMKLLTGIPVDAKTHALRLIGQIRGNRTSITEDEIMPATFACEKRYVDAHHEIDLSSIPDKGDSTYWETGMQKIDQVLNEEILPKIERGAISRLSIFALTRIPLVAYLGFRMGDKIPTTVYQKHKDQTEEWSWPDDGEEIDFHVTEHAGSSTEKITILASISGGDIEKVKQTTGEGLIYEIRPINEEPRLTLLRSPKTLENFRKTYRDLLSRIEAKHPKATQINLFMAAPTPIALICGRELRPEVQKVIVHDLIDGRYQPTLTLK